jgi:dTDP-4-amino-4,6-dideoxygalactose transaminase
MNMAAGPFIPPADPGAAYSARRQHILDAVARSFDTGYYILGAEVEAFENAFAGYLGSRHVIACANGTDALELALRAMGVGPGKGVFTVSHTAVATVAAIERAGGVPVFVDIDPASYTMSPESLAETLAYIKKRFPELEPSVIIPVHLYGHPCDMDPIFDIAEENGCIVLEDCAQAHGARYKGRLVGTLGRAASFSFYPTKNLGAFGDAGGLATNDAILAGDLAALRQYGWKEKYISAVPGINSRMDPVQAAILCIQLTHLEADNTERRRIAARYNDKLVDCGLALPTTADWAEHVYHLYVALCSERGSLMQFLHSCNIGTAIHYPLPVHLQPAYKGRIICAPRGLAVTERIRDALISLPMFPQLGENDVERVCAAVRQWASAGA